ncbi:hypothetical protein [Streptomyces lydicus]|uniref:hypothetical protein n=1 Tax=Streptomyces lydicus TaxID=47763 RepID=UPI0037CD0CB0
MGRHAKTVRSGAARQRARKGTARTAIGALLVLGVIALAGLLLRIPLNDLRYTTGLSGTPGTFSAEHCHAVRSGRVTSLTCTGTFVTADGRGTDHTAQLIDAPADHDQPITVQRKPDGSYVQPLVFRVALDLLAVFGIVAAAAMTVVIVRTGSSTAAVSAGVPARSRPKVWGPVLYLVSLLAIGCGAAAVLSFVVAVVTVWFPV